MIAVHPDPASPPPVGIGLRAPHVAAVMASPPAVDWLEVHAENYMAGPDALADLAAIRTMHPVSLHGVGLSLGSARRPDPGHLRRLKALVRRIDPALVSEHLSWSIVDGVYLNDLLPLLYTEESFGLVADRVDETQSAIGRRLLIENPSAYLRFSGSTITEADFLTALVARTGCGLLCDVNNLHVRARNLGEDADAALRRLPAAAVGEIHLAGHQANEVDGRTILIDDHGSPVAEPVWHLYRRAIALFGPVPTLVEWDSRLPALPVLVEEAERARRMAAAAALEACDGIAA
ncbi:MAG: DUF692 domain-containing protein [Alphaproteobacteria bacterium]